MQERIARFCRDKEVVGIGTGNTVDKIVKYLDSDKIYVPSSYQTMIALDKYNLKTKPLAVVDKVDLYIDGADYFDNLGNLIKGKGCALTNEKLLCSMSDEVLVLVQDYKFRESFNDCYVPIEIIPQSLGYIKSLITKAELPFSLRTTHNKHGPVLSDNGNFIIDVKYDSTFIHKLKQVSGVVEHGFFDGVNYNLVLEIFNSEVSRLKK